ncbi:hypothetical protein B0H19DRAFT_365008 [Mycena capillaripes]|nr:hypothetical protein B0H19DRAFT_365008 [Mycena capillaripes]
MGSIFETSSGDNRTWRIQLFIDLLVFLLIISVPFTPKRQSIERFGCHSLKAMNFGTVLRDFASNMLLFILQNSVVPFIYFVDTIVVFFYTHAALVTVAPIAVNTRQPDRISLRTKPLILRSTWFLRPVAHSLSRILSTLAVASSRWLPVQICRISPTISREFGGSDLICRVVLSVLLSPLSTLSADHTFFMQ